jgi:hypothetical protein
MTPYRVPETIQQENYNKALSRTRIPVEHTNGLGKNAFRIMDKSGGFLQYKPETLCKIATAVFMLFNKRIREKLPPPEEDQANLRDPADDSDSDESEDEDDEDPPVTAVEIRNQLTANFPANFRI